MTLVVQVLVDCVRFCLCVLVYVWVYLSVAYTMCCCLYLSKPNAKQLSECDYISKRRNTAILCKSCHFVTSQLTDIYKRL